MESIAEDAENMDQHSDHEDVRSEHSDQDHDNPPVEHDDGKSTFSFSLLTNKYSDERYCGVCLWYKTCLYSGSLWITGELSILLACCRTSSRGTQRPLCNMGNGLHLGIVCSHDLGSDWP